MTDKWKLKGTYFEACNCETACPCLFLGPPTDDECTALVGWHITKGRFGDVNLDDLNVALMVHSPGHMAKVEWNVVLYLDDTAQPAQAEALGKIFSGQAGGHFERISVHIGEVLGVENVAIDYQANNGSRSIKIGDFAEAVIEQIGGQGDAEVTVAKHPLAIAPGFPAVVARSSKLSYQGHGYDWEITEKSGLFSPFKYSAG